MRRTDTGDRTYIPFARKQYPPRNCKKIQKNESVKTIAVRNLTKSPKQSDMFPLPWWRGVCLSGKRVFVIGIRAVVDNLSVEPLISRLGLQTERPAQLSAGHATNNYHFLGGVPAMRNYLPRFSFALAVIVLLSLSAFRQATSPPPPTRTVVRPPRAVVARSPLT